VRLRPSVERVSFDKRLLSFHLHELIAERIVLVNVGAVSTERRQLTRFMERKADLRAPAKLNGSQA
jgi:hypothetical protein